MISIKEGPVKLLLTGPNRELRAISHRLHFHPKGYIYSPRFKAYQLTDGQEGWDGYISPIWFEDDEADQAECLRGHKDKIIDVARELGLAVSTRDCLISPFSEIIPDDIPNDLIDADFQLDQYQREAITFWLKHGMGVNKLPVNSGKTACCAAAAAMIQRRFPDENRILYITQSERLVRQAYTELRKFLPGFDITQYGGGKKDNTGKDIVISTVAMLWKHHVELRKSGFLNSFIGTVFDESHHCSSPTATKLLTLLPCYFRFGCSDTMKENDAGDRAKIQGLLGPIRYAVPVGVYIDSGRSAKPSIYMVRVPGWHNRFEDYPCLADPGTPALALVETGWKKGTYVGPVYERNEDGSIKVQTRKILEEGVDEAQVFTEEGDLQTIKSARWSYQELPVVQNGYHQIQFPDDPEPWVVESTYCLLDRVNDVALVKFKERNNLITEWVKYYSQQRKFPTLVVCTRTLHIYILEALITKVVGADKVRTLMGDHTSKQRDQAFDWFKHTPGAVLISPLVKEGVSINALRAGVVADHIGDNEVMMQIIGRFIRKKQTDNEAHITVFMDNQHPILHSGSKRIWNKLYDTRGFTFYDPVHGPDSISRAKVYEKLD